MSYLLDRFAVRHRGRFPRQEKREQRENPEKGEALVLESPTDAASMQLTSIVSSAVVRCWSYDLLPRGRTQGQARWHRHGTEMAPRSHRDCRFSCLRFLSLCLLPYAHCACPLRIVCVCSFEAKADRSPTRERVCRRKGGCMIQQQELTPIRCDDPSSISTLAMAAECSQREVLPPRWSHSPTHFAD